MDAMERARGEGAAEGIDRVHLDRQTFGSLDLQREVLTLFLTQARETIVQMRTRADGRGALAHRLKGAARGVGAWGVAEACSGVEVAGDARGAIDLLETRVTAVAQVVETGPWGGASAQSRGR